MTALEAYAHRSLPAPGIPFIWGDPVLGCWFEIEHVPPLAGSAIRLYFYRRDEETGERHEVGCASFPFAMDELQEATDDALDAGFLWLSLSVFFLAKARAIVKFA